MQRDTILNYRCYRYFWFALLLVSTSLGVYYSQAESRPPNGGTWQGYYLGTVGALLILWLPCIGIRKRAYSSSMGTVQGWTSAHVYLGSALLLIATLHCAFQFGFNVHTLAYVLMLIVIVSGIYGLVLYQRYPRSRANNLDTQTFKQLFAELSELNNQVLELSDACGGQVKNLVESALSRTVFSADLFSTLFGVDRSTMESPNTGPGTSANLVPNQDQQALIDTIAKLIPQGQKANQGDHLQTLLTMLARRQVLQYKIRRDIRLQGWLRIWLFVHVPVTIALLAALTIHIVVVFLFW